MWIVDSKMWSKMVVVGTGGLGIEVHTCFGCSNGLVKGLQCSTGIGFVAEGLGLVETGHSVALGEGLGMVETV